MTSCYACLYNTTFSLYRVSPFYTKSSKSPTNKLLAEFAQKFQGILTTDALSGLNKSLVTKGDVLLRAGLFQKVTLTVLQNDNITGLESDEEDTSAEISNDERRGMLITISYEKVEYRAIFLEDTSLNDISVDKKKRKNGFHHFPLLLIKMPASLRKIFIDYLAATFDTRVSNLYLGDRCLIECFERFISGLSSTEHLDSGEEDMQTNLNFENIIKDVVVKLGFDLPNGSIKAIEIHISSDDFSRMMNMGERSDHNIPFFEVLGTYLKAHLALDIWNSKVHITRISCAAFNVDIEGKMKLIQPANFRANTSQIRSDWALISSLVETAIGTLLPNLNSNV